METNSTVMASDDGIVTTSLPAKWSGAGVRRRQRLRTDGLSHFGVYNPTTLQ